MDVEHLKIIMESLSGMTDGAFWGFISYLGLGALKIFAITGVIIFIVKTVASVITKASSNEVIGILDQVEGHANGTIEVLQNALSYSYYNSKEKEFREYLKGFVKNG